MGGTSCGHRPGRERQPAILDRVPASTSASRSPSPASRCSTIGAGGGSIAWIDKGGLLQVGPQSAGAEPGPVCYGRGGTEATVTDANLVLGRLDPDYFLGGAMPLDAEAARAALAPARRGARA